MYKCVFYVFICKKTNLFVSFISCNVQIEYNKLCNKFSTKYIKLGTSVYIQP